MKRNFQRMLSMLLVVLTIVSMISITAVSSSAKVTLVWPVPGHKRLSQGFHDGRAIDISDSVITGATVVAALGGTVLQIRNCNTTHYGTWSCSNKCDGYGTYVAITGTDGRIYMYAHLQYGSIPSNIYAGASVSAGQKLGTVGNTGNSSGAHLHFGISKNTIYDQSGQYNPQNETYVDTPTPSYNTYTIKYNANGGSGSMSDTSATYMKYIVLTSNRFTKTGYEFTGWNAYRHSDKKWYCSGYGWLTESEIASIGCEKSLYYDGLNCLFDDSWVIGGTKNDTITFYAQWNSTTYTITFNANGGTCSTASKAVTYNTAYGTLPTPTRTNYTFRGWFTQPTDGTKVTASTIYTIAGNQTLYAQWKHICIYSYKVTKTPTTSATGTLTGTCSKCSATTTVALPKLTTTDYNYSVVKAANCTAIGTGRYTWKTTTYGSFYIDVSISATGHSWSAWTQTVAPTGTSTGTEVRTCSRCSEKQSQSIPKLTLYTITYNLDNGSLAEGKTNPATYTVNDEFVLNNPTRKDYIFQGWKEASSGVVGNKYTFTNAKDGNSYSGFKIQLWTCENGIAYDFIGNVATGTTDKSGSYTFTGETGYYKMRIGANGSTEDNCLYLPDVYLEKGKTYNYSWTMDSYSTQEIKISNFSFYESALPGGPMTAIMKGTTGNKTFTAQWKHVCADGHTWSEWAEITAPTCIANGEEKRTCSVCGETETRVITAKGEHTWSEWEETQAPTCIVNGEEKRTCSVCGETETRVITAKGEHTWGEWEETIAPDCGNDGSQLRSCTLCGETESETISMTGDHNWQISSTGKPTYTTEGSKWYKCTVCTATKKESIPKLEGLTYAVEGGNIYCDPQTGAIADCDTTVTYAVIPESIDGIKITAIGEYAFYDCQKITHITIPDSVLSMGMLAFARCEKLESIVLSKNITRIPREAFYSCHALKSINIPNGVTQIDEYAFYNCTKLSEINIPNSVISIGKLAFADTHLSTITLPGMITSIGKDAFRNRNNINTIIRCYEGTYPETYALENGIPIEYLVCDHANAEWIETVVPTTENEGERVMTCPDCGVTETEILPMLKKVEISVENYNVIFTAASRLDHIRYASGIYNTAAEIRNAEDVRNVNATIIANGTTDDIFTYEMQNGGVYSFWIRFTDGTTRIEHLDFSTMTQSVSTEGLMLTVHNLYGVKDYFVGKGTYNSYRELKNGETVGRVTATKIAGAKSFTTILPDNGDYTVCVRYDDPTRPDLMLYFSVEVDMPEIEVNGLQVLMSGLTDVRVIRTAPGTWETPGEVKRAEGARNIKGSALKGSDTLTLQYSAEGTYTLTLEYYNGLIVVKTFEIKQKEPTVEQNGNSVTFGDLDDMYIIRYAKGEYTTSAEIKNASGSKFKKPNSIVDGHITVDNLESGTYTFCVQYNDMSYNYYTIVVE